MIFKLTGIILTLMLAGMQFGCGYGTRYLVSNTFYQSGHVFNETPKDRDLEYVTVNFESSDGDILHGWLVAGRKDLPLIIYFHGNISNVTHGLEKIELLNKQGFTIFSFEYRGYGKSEGAALYEDDFYRDARSALRWVNRQGWNNNDIIYYGHSLGAAVAINLALEQPPLSLLLESAFTSYADMAKHKVSFLTLLERLRIYELDKKTSEFDNINKVPKLKRPIVFYHCASDVIVPSQMSEALFRLAKEPKRLRIVKGANHINSLELANSSLVDDLTWLISVGQKKQMVQ